MTDGHVILSLRFDIDDAEAATTAGRRSYARDLRAELPPPGSDLELPDDADVVIDGPAQAVVDLLVEAWNRCYRPAGPVGLGQATGGPLIDPVDSIDWGDVIAKSYLSRDDDYEDEGER